MAALGLTEPNEAYPRQHERVETRDGVAYGDVVERVDFDYVARVARVNAAAIATLALAPSAPSGVRFGSARQAYDTRLSRTRGNDPDRARYRLAWRAPHQPFWERSLDGGARPHATPKG